MKADSTTVKVLECLLCKERYSQADIEAGLYQLETFVCARCYVKMQNQPHHVSCFGKPTYILPTKRLFGYNPNTPECARWCPDRKVCSRIIRGGDTREAED